MKLRWLFASTAALMLASAPALAQIKAGIPPKSRSQIEAERVAKAERANAAAQADRRHAETFARLDSNKDGAISAEEYRAAGALQEAAEDHLTTRTR